MSALADTELTLPCIETQGKIQGACLVLEETCEVIEVLTRQEEAAVVPRMADSENMRLEHESGKVMSIPCTIGMPLIADEHPAVSF